MQGANVHLLIPFKLRIKSCFSQNIFSIDTYPKYKVHDNKCCVQKVQEIFKHNFFHLTHLQAMAE